MCADDTELNDTSSRFHFVSGQMLVQTAGTGGPDFIQALCGTGCGSELQLLQDHRKTLNDIQKESFLHFFEYSSNRMLEIRERINSDSS